MSRSRLLLAVFVLLVPSAARAQDGWGKIQGRIVWPDANVPAPVLIPAAAPGCPPAIPGQNWVVNPKNKGIRWVLVWLDPMKPTDPVPLNPALKMAPKVVMDQPKCVFEPHVLGLREGQVLEVKNSDNIAHNVNYTGKLDVNPGENVLVPGGKSLEIKNLKAQELPLSFACNIHRWMSAKVAVFSHPYFAVTDADGQFQIAGAPPGTWRLKVWHQEIGFLGGAVGRKTGRPVTLKKGGAIDLGEIALAGAK